MSHTVRGAKINVIATFKVHGIKLLLSRPVDRDGQRRRKGWMLSCDGIAMAFLNECEEVIAKGYFERQLVIFRDAAYLRQCIETTKTSMTTDTWRSP